LGLEKNNQTQFLCVFSLEENEAKACIYRAIDWPSSVNASYGQKLQIS